MSQQTSPDPKKQGDHMRPEDGPYEVPRIDKQGRLLCHAHKRGTGELCEGPAMKGQRVCRVHGGSAKQSREAAKLRLIELVDPAIATLAREMVQADKSADKQRAANSVLDRAGIARVNEVKGEDAKNVLVEKLRKMRQTEAQDN